MYITFLVGNGFDIAAGLATSYSDFYKWYCEQPSPSENIEQFKKEISLDIEHGGQNWSDFEIGLGKHSTQFSSDTVQLFIDRYEDAHTKMAEYLALSEQKYNVQCITDEAVVAFGQSVMDFYQELSPSEKRSFSEIMKNDAGANTIVSFISFNYTNILDQYAAALKDKALKTWSYNGLSYKFIIKSEVLHIHGTTTTYPILGVSEERHVINAELLQNLRLANTFLKPQGVNTVGQLWYEDAEKMIGSSKIICIYGMSLGVSDSYWWNKIMLWLGNNSNRHLIVFWHSKSVKNTVSVLARYDEVAAVQKILIGYTDFTLDKIQDIASRIHVVVNAEKMLTVPRMQATDESKELVLT